MPVTFQTSDAVKNIKPFSSNKNPFQKKNQGPMSIYERALRGIAREVGRIIKGIASDDPLAPQVESQVFSYMNAYSELLGPWALHLCNNVFTMADNADRFAWQQHTKNMSLALRKELNNAPTGDVVRNIMGENVKLIKSIPLEAAKRVHKLIQANMMQSERSTEIAKKIMETEYVTKNRATLIARTEVSKASTALTQARATYVGSDGYIWRTSGDLIVRPSHKAMSGKFVRWDSPPTLDNMMGAAGSFPNCRCWCDVVLPEE